MLRSEFSRADIEIRKLGYPCKELRSYPIYARGVDVQEVVQR
jgi:hypothetical protein